MSDSIWKPDDNEWMAQRKKALGSGLTFYSIRQDHESYVCQM